jgi:acyl-CoA synthetase (AMP-forming)/AMP-acid ligase II
MHNTIESALAYIVCLRVGAIAMLLNTRLTAAQPQ